MEYLVYQKVLQACGCSSEVNDLLTVFAAKCIKPVVSGEGLKASFHWCRGSGDLDTSLGNGILNYITTMYFMCHNFCSTQCKLSSCSCGFYDKFVLKGDDSYGCAPKKNLVNTYEWFGLEAKLIYRPDARRTEFCSGHFVRAADGKWTYVQKLRKLLTSLSTVINPDIIKNGWVGHYLKSLGLMYKVLYSGIPVYEDLADMLLTADSDHGLNINLIQGTSYGAWEAFKTGNASKVGSCAETLLDISEHNDMSLAELDALRRTFRSTKILLPEHMRRRCNWKTKITHESFVDPGDVINTWVNRLELSAEARRIRKLLCKITHDNKKLASLFNEE